MHKIIFIFSMELIKKFNLYFWVISIVLIIITLSIVSLIWWKIEDLFFLFDLWYKYKDSINIIQQNQKYSIPLFFAYLVFLWYISSKKWLSIVGWINWSYFQIIVFVYKILNFFMIFFLYYLFSNSKWGEGCIILFLIIVIWSIIPKLMQSYDWIRKDYKELQYINSLKLNDLKELFQINDNNSLIRWLIFYITLSVNYFQYLTIILSFVIIPLTLTFKFNMISVLYIHISFVSLFIVFSILKNKFPSFVTITYKGSKKKWFLLEYWKINTHLLLKEKTVILRTDLIDMIESKNLL